MLWGSGKQLINGDRYHADHFRQTSDSFQTYDRLQTNFGQTSDVRLLLQTLDLSLTSNIRLRILDFWLWFSHFRFETPDRLRTSDMIIQTLNFRLSVQILDFGYILRTDLVLRILNFGLCISGFGQYILLQISSDFGLQTSDFEVQSSETPTGF